MSTVNSCYDDVLLNHELNPVPGAMITVYLHGTTTLANLFDANDIAIPNPVLTGASGDFEFWTVGGNYDLRASGGTPPITPSVLEIWLPDVGGGGLVTSVAGKTGDVILVEPDVTNLVTDLAGKAPTVHVHVENDVTNLVTDLAGKSPVGHTHPPVPLNNPGFGGFFGPGQTFPYPIYGQTLSNGAIGTTINQITVFQFVLNFAITLSKVSVRVGAGAAGKTASFGIYSSSKSKLVDSGAMSFATTASTVSNSFTAVTLQPGVYWFAQSVDSTTLQTPQLPPSSAALTDMYNRNAVRAGQCSNLTSSGVMPASLGTITADTLYIGIAVPLWEV